MNAFHTVMSESMWYVEISHTSAGHNYSKAVSRKRQNNILPTMKIQIRIFIVTPLYICIHALAI